MRLDSRYDWTAKTGDDPWAIPNNNTNAVAAYGFYHDNSADDYPWDAVIWIQANEYTVLPGVPTISIGGKFVYLHQQSPRNAGKTYIPQGIAPREVSVSFACWTPDQMAKWAMLIPKLLPDPKTYKMIISGGQNVATSDSTYGNTAQDAKTMMSLHLYHPLFPIHGMMWFICSEITGPTVEQAGGGFTIEAKLQEVLPLAKTQLAKPSQSNVDPKFQGTGPGQAPFATFSGL